MNVEIRHQVEPINRLQWQAVRGLGPSTSVYFYATCEIADYGTQQLHINTSGSGYSGALQIPAGDVETLIQMLEHIRKDLAEHNA